MTHRQSRWVDHRHKLEKSVSPLMNWATHYELHRLQHGFNRKVCLQPHFCIRYGGLGRRSHGYCSVIWNPLTDGHAGTDQRRNMQLMTGSRLAKSCLQPRSKVGRVSSKVCMNWHLCASHWSKLARFQFSPLPSSSLPFISCRHKQWERSVLLCHVPLGCKSGRKRKQGERFGPRDYGVHM